MLELRPSCEHCQKSLPAHAIDAMICSYECTFCQTCVTEILQNVCPNCGGGFVPRPIRPKHSYINGVSIEHQPASENATFKPINCKQQKLLISKLAHIKPENR